jgi:hypothetical protein
MPAIGRLGDSLEEVGLELASDEPAAAQRLAESYFEKGERISAVSVLTDAAAKFSEGRFPAPAVELVQRILDAGFDASPLTTVAETCLEHGGRKELVAAVRLLGIAHEHDRANTRTLELLVRAFEKMGLDEKAQRVKAVLTEISEEEPTLPIVAAHSLSQS